MKTQSKKWKISDRFGVGAREKVTLETFCAHPYQRTCLFSSVVCLCWLIFVYVGLFDCVELVLKRRSHKSTKSTKNYF